MVINENCLGLRRIFNENNLWKQLVLNFCKFMKTWLPTFTHAYNILCSETWPAQLWRKKDRHWLEFIIPESLSNLMIIFNKSPEEPVMVQLKTMHFTFKEAAYIESLSLANFGMTWVNNDRVFVIVFTSNIYLLYVSIFLHLAFVLPSLLTDTMPW